MSKSHITEEKVLKSVKNAGTTTNALGILSAIVTFLYYLVGGTSIGMTILYSVISLAFFLPLVFLGKKIKEDNLENLEETKKRLNGTGIYMIVLIFVGLFLGALPGVFAILATIQLFSAKKQVNLFIKQKNER